MGVLHILLKMGHPKIISTQISEQNIFSNSNHLEWRAGLSDTILKGTHPGIIPARFALIWLCGFRGKDLNKIFYQNMPNLHNQYKLAERKKTEIYVKLLISM
jgi:hypothetical protein